MLRLIVQLRSDQVLRERGEGDTALTNPHIHLRRRYRKLYEDFKPHVLFWRLVLLARKLCLAVIVVLLSGNVQAQVRVPMCIAQGTFAAVAVLSLEHRTVR